MQPEVVAPKATFEGDDAAAWEAMLAVMNRKPFEVRHELSLREWALLCGVDVACRWCITRNASLGLTTLRFSAFQEA